MKITLNVTRPNGEIEVVDITTRFGAGINQNIFNKIKTDTAKAGRGVVNYVKQIETKSNLNQLAREWNNLHNEGAEGYIPLENLMKSDKYKEWETETIFK